MVNEQNMSALAKQLARYHRHDEAGSDHCLSVEDYIADAFRAGLSRGLELAKEHATAHQANAAGELEIGWAAADEAVRKESL